MIKFGKPETFTESYSAGGERYGAWIGTVTQTKASMAAVQAVLKELPPEIQTRNVLVQVLREAIEVVDNMTLRTDQS